MINAFAKQPLPSLHIITLYGPSPISQSPTHIHFPTTEEISFYQYKHTFLIIKALPKTEFSITRKPNYKKHNSKDLYLPSSSSSLIVKIYQGCLFINYDHNELINLQVHTPHSRYTLTDQPAEYIVTPQSIIKVIPTSTPKVRLLFDSCHQALKPINTNRRKFTINKQ
jgi:hypothetical protein